MGAAGVHLLYFKFVSPTNNILVYGWSWFITFSLQAHNRRTIAFCIGTDLMPSWPTRLPLASSATSSPSSHPTSRGLRSPPYHAEEVERFQDPPLHGVPIIALTESFAPSHPGHRPRHERAHSHPFPSIFGSGKRTDREVEIDDQDEIIDDLYNPPILSPGLASKDYMASTSGVYAHSAEKDLMTGNCSTCDSTVRWPRHLGVFRCTVCLMINDLKPAAGLLGDVRSAEASNPSHTSARPVLPKKGASAP